MNTYTVLLVLDVVLRQSVVLHMDSPNACLALKQEVIKQVAVDKRKQVVVQCVLTPSVEDELLERGGM